MSLSLANNLTLLVNCESTTNWSGDNTLTTEASMAKQGTYAVGWNVDIETLTCKCDLTAERGSAQNLTNTVIYFWVYLVQPETTDGWDNGGVRLYLEDGSGNYSEWSVCGGGGGGSYRNYYGGYRRFAVDTSATPDYVSGTLRISSVTEPTAPTPSP
jgi:hypothetical protein